MCTFEWNNGATFGKDCHDKVFLKNSQRVLLTLIGDWVMYEDLPLFGK